VHNVERGRERGVAHGFLIHRQGDDVGVAVRDLRAGETADGVYMDSADDDGRVTVTLVSDVPLGHKLALRELPAGHEAREYGEIIGRMTQPARAGEHVHTHNIRSVRWG
jgi:(2R)-sulfolactate sulfo-lyase subunit alpha